MASLSLLLFVIVAVSRCVAFLPYFGLKSTRILAPVAPKSWPSSTSLFLSTADFKNGMTFELDGTPVRLQEFLHVKPGKGSAFVRTKIKNLMNGSVQERTFRAGESITAADVEKSDMQYTYTNGNFLYFMNMETFEEQCVDKSLVPNVDLMIEGLSCSVNIWNGRVIEVTLPQSGAYTVADTSPAIKGQQQGTMKEATLDSGATILIPMFIEAGEQVLVSTEDRKYLSRVNAKSFS